MDSFTSDDILGLDVIDAQGDYIGVVDKLFFDKESLEFTGISIDKGFLKKGLMIGKDHVRRVSKQALFLGITPATTLKSKVIFDSLGKRIGSVSEVIQFNNTNKVNYLLCKTKSGLVKIPASVIDVASVNIFLKVTLQQLKERLKKDKPAN